MPIVHHQGISLHFTDSGGDGRPLLLGHSFLCDGRMWAPQIGPLSERYRVINLDARGHGRSGPAAKGFTAYDQVGDALAVLDHLGVKRAIWLGLSMGGMVAMRAALVAPERVAGLALLDTSAGVEPRANKIKYRVMGIGARVLGMRRMVPAVLPLMFSRTAQRQQPELVATWVERFATFRVGSALAGMQMLVTRDDLTPRLKEISAPTLVLVGAQDRATPPVLSQRIAAGIPGAELLEVPSAGHLSTLERPGTVTRALLQFLDGLGEDSSPSRNDP